MIIFDKYELHGDYHWQDYGGDNDYTRHVDYLVEWIGEGHIATDITASGRLLDIGAGDGLITSKFKNCLGVESSSLAVELAHNHNANVTTGSAYNLPASDKLVGSILFGDVLEHLEFPALALSEARRVLTDDGSLYIAVPPWVYMETISKYHYREYTEQTLKESVEQCGFVLDGEMYEANTRIYAKFKKADIT